ncbi:MAG: peptidylprolyl isomerase [Candidatus Latescibacterota bacterium]
MCSLKNCPRTWLALPHIRTLFLVIVGSLSTINFTYAQQQELIRIAAIVNDEIISIFDLENRVRLIAATTNSKQKPEVLKRLKPQVLRQMIDERIQLQEAKKLNIHVNSREFNGTIANLERQNKLRPGQVWSFLRSNNVDRSAFEMQIRARISWMKLINRRIRRQISVGQDEINQEIARLKNLMGKPQLHVLEIFLSVDAPEFERQTSQIADRLISQILNGARFGALAREFSQSTTAARGGNLGWITESELDPELTVALSVMQPGQVSRPIRTLSGYYILFLMDRREGSTGKASNITVKYRQMIAPVPRGALPSEAEDQRK